MKLKILDRTHEFVLDVYAVTKGFPKKEMFGLTGQMRRSATSIPANIVEGQSRNTTKDYLSYLYNARGSHAEIGYYLQLSNDLSIFQRRIMKGCGKCVLNWGACSTV
ncbi:MAG TPA: four helix bundle protein [Dissulfurispiraceae bacterium]|nr:four helix bundle protein [Dissulfurispiraceae bacterium]